MKIGVLSQRTGVPISALRFYESLGLLQSGRTGGNYRDFPEEMVDQVRRIQNFRTLNLSLPEIKKILESSYLSGDSCLEVCQLIESNLVRVRQQIRQLKQLEKELKRLADLCPGLAGPNGCQIINELEQKP